MLDEDAMQDLLFDKYERFAVTATYLNLLYGKEYTFMDFWDEFDLIYGAWYNQQSLSRQYQYNPRVFKLLWQLLWNSAQPILI